MFRVPDQRGKGRRTRDQVSWLDPSEVGNELQTLIFQSVIIKRNICHDASGEDFPFAERLDDKLVGRDYELSINVITPFHDDPGNESKVRMRTLASDELAVVFPPDERFRPISWPGRRPTNTSGKRVANQPKRRQAHHSRKGGTERPARPRLVTKVRALLTQARLYVRGEEVEIRVEDAEVRVAKGFQALVGKVYTNLPMLRGETYSEFDIVNSCAKAGKRSKGSGIRRWRSPKRRSSTSPRPMRASAFEQRSRRSSKVRDEVRWLVAKCDPGAYRGSVWPGQVRCFFGWAALEGPALESALRNSQKLPNIVLELQAEFTPGQIRKLKEFYTEFFDSPPRRATPRRSPRRPKRS